MSRDIAALLGLLDTACAHALDGAGCARVPERDQVFISYSKQADQAFARQLADWLRAAAFNVWLDEEQLKGGDDYEAKINDALAECNYAVFLVSRPWLERDWTRFESKRFAALGSERRRIAVLRGPLAGKALPPELDHLHNFSWSDDDDPAAPLWQLVCALTDDQLGARREWAVRGGEIIARVALARSNADESLVGEAGAIDRELGEEIHLRCDRDPQWGALGLLLGTRKHAAILVTGAPGEAHAALSQRVARMLPRDPSRRIVSVTWTGGECPHQSKQLLADLAVALEVPETALIAHLQAQLERRNVIVLQPTTRCFGGDALIGFLHHVVPTFLLSIGKTPFGLKIMQPIEATPPGLGSRISGWTRRLIGSADEDGFADIEAFIAKARGKAAALELPVSLLPQLTPIGRAELETFCERENVPLQRRTAFIDAVLQDARTSEDILKNIRRHFPRS